MLTSPGKISIPQGKNVVLKSDVNTKDKPILNSVKTNELSKKRVLAIVEPL